MNPKKAIEILTLMGKPGFEGHTEDILAARQLGIEALKWRLLMEADYGSWCGPLLPGETQD